jgi:hypothetical protein
VTPESRKSGGELFIVDNADERWKVQRYLHDWCDIAEAFDIATAYFEIGSLLATRTWPDCVEKLLGDSVFPSRFDTAATQGCR